MDHLLNFFPIINQTQLKVSYRSFEVGSIPEGVDLPHNLQLIRRHIQREYGTPATWITQNGKSCLAVGTTPKKKEYPIGLDAPILQGLTVPLRLTPPITETKFNNPSDDEQEIISSFLDFNIRSMLRATEDQLWKGNSPYIFYTRKSKQLGNRGSDLTLYPGFSCRTQFLPNIGFGLVIDTLSVFIDSRTLAEHKLAGEDWRTWIGRHFVYEFGNIWYFVHLKNVEKKSIKDAQFTDPRTGITTNLFDYLNSRWEGRKSDRLKTLNPEDLAVTYGSPKQPGEKYAPASLIRLRYKTSEEPAQNFHTQTILEPEDRLRDIEKIITTYMNGKTKLEGISFSVETQPASIPHRVFPIPKQLFGNKSVLSSPEMIPRSIEDSWRKRKNWLRDNNIGIFSREDGIVSQFMLVPSSLTNDEDEADSIEHDLKSAVQNYSPIPYNPKLVVWDDENATTIPQIRATLTELKKSMVSAGTSCALVVLPANRSKAETGKLRRHIKKTLSPEVRTKCVQASELLHHMRASKKDERDAGRYRSYLMYTAFDILVTSGHRLWVINEALNYDLYIGIDVLNNTAGFTFVAGGGAICRFISSTSDQKEQLSAEQIVEVLGKHLREIIPRVREILGHLPRHIVIHRDGRWFSTESQGFSFITDKLYHEGLLPENIVKGVVEIQKTNAQRWRLLARENRKFQNPIVGSYYTFTANQGIICTAGIPGRIPGTVKPLLANIAEGNLDIEKVLRDIFWLSVLAWTKPDGLQSLPITIKLADDWLEPIAAAISENEALFGALDQKVISSSIPENSDPRRRNAAS